jgi:hypothetical protein
VTFDVSRLRRGERIAAIGGVLLFILLFFNWYDISVSISAAGITRSGDVASVSAWDAFSFIDIYLLVVALVAIGLAALTASQRTPALPVTASVITTAVAALGTLLILFRIVDTPGGSGSFFGGSVDVSPTIWAFVALIVTAGITYAGYLSMREEGTTLGDVRAQASAAFEGSGSGSGGSGSNAPPSEAAPPAPPSAMVPPPPPSAMAPPPPVPSPAPTSEPPADSAPPANAPVEGEASLED